MLGILLSAKMSSAEFLKLAFSSIFFSKNTIRIANSLDPDETPRSVVSHLDPNCLQRPSKFGSSIERVNVDTFFIFTLHVYKFQGLSFSIFVKLP